MVQPNVTMFTFWEVAGGRLSFGRCGVGIVGGRQWVGGLNLPSNRKRLACNPVCTSTAAFISDQFRKIINLVGITAIKPKISTQFIVVSLDISLFLLSGKIFLFEEVGAEEVQGVRTT